MKKLLTLSALVCMSVGASAATQNSGKQWKVDYSGKPPYKRELVELTVVDAAQSEAVETALVRSTDFSGKPPFKRNVETLEVVDAAVLESTDTEDKKTRTGRPPFKRH